MDKTLSKNPISHLRSIQQLNLAIREGDLPLCKALIELGVKLESSVNDCHGCTPVLQALLFDRVDIASYLIEAGASTVGQVCPCVKFSTPSGK